MKRKHLLAIVGGLALSLNSGAWAGALQQCRDGADNDADVSACLSRALHDAERELDDLVRDVRSTIQRGEGRRPVWHSLRAFDEAQNLFIAYRGNNCNWHYNEAPRGADAGHVLRACMVRLTRQRIAELRLYLNHE